MNPNSDTSNNSWAPAYTTLPWSVLGKPQSSSTPNSYSVFADASDTWLDEWDCDHSNPTHSSHTQPRHDSSPQRQHDNHDGSQQHVYSYPQQTMRSHSPLSITYSPPATRQSPPKHTSPHPVPAPVSHPASSSSCSPYQSATIAPAETYNQPPLCLYQPQPIRPIPIIPLSAISLASAEFSVPPPSSTVTRRRFAPYSLHKPHSGTTLSQIRESPRTKTNRLSSRSLLCQPVPDSVRYQIKPVDKTDTDESQTTTSNMGTSLMDESCLNSSPSRSRGLSREIGGLFCTCGCMGSAHSLVVSNARGWR